MKNATRMYNVYAVVGGMPIAKVNARRMTREAAESKAAKLVAAGSPRAYAVKDGGK
jgi:hypothetical protein